MIKDYSLNSDWYIINSGQMVGSIVLNAAYQQGILKDIRQLDKWKYYVCVGHAIPSMPSLWTHRKGSMREPIELTKHITFKILRNFGDESFGPAIGVDVKIGQSVYSISDSKDTPGFLFQEV